MALDELYDWYCVECNHCLQHYRFDPRWLAAVHRKLVSLDEHGSPRTDVLKGKGTIARMAIRDGWISYTATTHRFSSTCHLCPDCQTLNDYGENIRLTKGTICSPPPPVSETTSTTYANKQPHWKS